MPLDVRINKIVFSQAGGCQRTGFVRPSLTGAFAKPLKFVYTLSELGVFVWCTFRLETKVDSLVDNTSYLTALSSFNYKILHGLHTNDDINLSATKIKFIFLAFSYTHIIYIYMCVCVCVCVCVRARAHVYYHSAKTLLTYMRRTHLCKFT